MGSERCFPQTGSLVSRSPEEHAEDERAMLKAAAAALKQVKAAALSHRDVAGGGIYVGLGGVALTYLRLAQAVARGAAFKHGAYLRKHSASHSLGLAAHFLGEADKLMSSKRVTFLEGTSGLLAAQALLAHLQGDAAGVRAKVEELGRIQGRIQGALPAGDCELLYGRAGYLYSLLWLQQQLGGSELFPRALIKAVVAHLLDEGMAGAQAVQGGAGRWGLMYAWHGKRYLGAAHGLAGVLYVLLAAWPAVLELDREREGARVAAGCGRCASAVASSLSALAGSALPSGNLATKLGDSQDVRVAWCHGAAGFVLTMLKAAQVLGDDDGTFTAAASNAGRALWARGLLRKGVGLCHGISGNGYALLALHRATGSPEHLAAARAFGLYAAQHWQELYEVPDRPASLFEGLAGAVNFWLDLTAGDLQQARFPGAEL